MTSDDDESGSQHTQRLIRFMESLVAVSIVDDCGGVIDGRFRNWFGRTIRNCHLGSRPNDIPNLVVKTIYSEQSQK